MFLSFFPKPKWFFLSALLWCGLAIAAWYFGGRDLGAVFGMAPLGEGEQAPIGVGVFWSPPFLWFYIYFLIWSAFFAAFWIAVSRHPWARWSVLGTLLILFLTYFQVQVSVAVNAWYGPFYDLIQKALSAPNAVSASELYRGLLQFCGIAALAVAIYVFIQFFVSHYVFRWRTAMNQFYVAHWDRLRHVEGASQRVQEDTMRFARTLEALGVAAIRSVMTLLAFMPVLFALSQKVTSLPLLGSVPNGLVFAGLIWSIFGTGLVALIGIKLPGLEFNNQRVEAAYRKELVYGEDHADRADPPTLAELFSGVRRNYFTLYFHYLYFNVGFQVFAQADNVFGYILLVPTLAAGAITFGTMNQILNVFDKVRESFQYLIASWPTIIELLSIYKRLRGFEAMLGMPPLADTPQPPPEVDSSKPAQEAGLA